MRLDRTLRHDLPLNTKMSKQLKEIKEPIDKELKAFETYFADAMKSKVPLLDKITYYIVRRKGKQMRPMFVFLSALCCGEISSATYEAAAMIELLHTGTLVHDDVVDDSLKRRGFFSINALWKNKIAVLVGDYLLSKGMLIALENDRFQLLKIVSKSMKAMIEGELLQSEKARKLDINEDLYYEIIENKTASLIAASCSAGAASATEDPETVELMRQFGVKIGIAFQIKDDLFDYGDEEIGKPTGIDIKEKKMTLPLIYTLNKVDEATKKTVIRNIKRHSTDKNKVREIIDLVKRTGGLEYARKAMLDYQNQAFDLLHQMPENPGRKSLEDLVRFVTERKK